MHKCKYIKWLQGVSPTENVVMWTNSMMDLPFVFTNGQKVG